MRSLKLPANLNKYIFPGFLLVLAILTYGLFAFQQGFYLDDWYITLFQKYFGASSFIKFFQEDRPFLGYVYRIFLPIFKDSPAAWQIFAVFTRWLVTLTFWGVLNKLFPNQKNLWKWVAILFLVYPGFQFHWFAIMYSQIYLLMAVYFTSYFFMYKAVTRRNPWWVYALWTTAALISVVIGIVPMEYFYGMELFRPIVLYLILQREYPRPRKAVGQALLHWLPYLAIFTGFTVFRILYSSKYSYQVGILEQLSNNPFDALQTLVSNGFWSVFDATVTAWWNLIQLFNKDLFTFASMAMVALMIFGVIVTYLILRKGLQESGKEKQIINGWKLMASGLFLTVAALAPFIAASFPVSLEFPSNRFLLALAPGISIFMAGAIDELLRTENQKLALVALLCGLSIGSHFMTSRGFMLQWQAQKDFFWQLTWRVPSLLSGTALVSEDLPFSQYFSGTSLSAPLNMIYSPENMSSNLDNVILLTSSPQADVIPAYEPGIDLNYSYRFLDFTGNTNALITFYKPSKGCLRLFSPEDSSEEFVYSKRYLFWHNSIAISNLDRIIADPPTSATPPAKYFGKENRNQWCYYFEKADLARQTQEWEMIISLYAQADNAGFSPVTIQEWLPLMQAYIQTGRYDQAAQVNRSLQPSDITETAGLCGLFKRMAGVSSISLENAIKITDMSEELQCGAE